MYLNGLLQWLSRLKKKSACNGDTGDVGSILGLARSPGGGNDNPLQYSHLKNPMDRGAWQATVQKDCKNLDTTEWLSVNACGIIELNHC